jgi:hypothetical protein
VAVPLIMVDLQCMVVQVVVELQMLVVLAKMD